MPVGTDPFHLNGKFDKIFWMKNKIMSLIIGSVLARALLAASGEFQALPANEPQRLPVNAKLRAAYLAQGHTSIENDTPVLLSGEPVGDIAAKRHRYWTLVQRHLAPDFNQLCTRFVPSCGRLPRVPQPADEPADADTAVLFPTDSLMVGFEPVPQNARESEAVRTARLVRRVEHALTAAQHPFTFVDADRLATGTLTNRTLILGPLHVHTVVLPGVSTLPTTTARQLTAFQLAGGRVLAVGDRPVNSTRLFPDAEIYQLGATWTFIPEARTAQLPDVISRP